MSENSTPGQIEVRFITKQERFAVPDTPFSIPSKTKVENLSSLVNQLLKGMML